MVKERETPTIPKKRHHNTHFCMRVVRGEKGVNASAAPAAKGKRIPAMNAGR
jgi:hypothetical protein